jgi:hypothetical protein
LLDQAFYFSGKKNHQNNITKTMAHIPLPLARRAFHVGGWYFIGSVKKPFSFDSFESTDD